MGQRQVKAMPVLYCSSEHAYLGGRSEAVGTGLTWGGLAMTPPMSAIPDAAPQCTTCTGFGGHAWREQLGQRADRHAYLSSVWVQDPAHGHGHLPGHLPLLLPDRIPAGAMGARYGVLRSYAVPKRSCLLIDARTCPLPGNSFRAIVKKTALSAVLGGGLITPTNFATNSCLAGETTDELKQKLSTRWASRQSEHVSSCCCA